LAETLAIGSLILRFDPDRHEVGFFGLETWRDVKKC